MLPDAVRERVTSYIQHQAGKSRPAILDLVADSQRRLLELAESADEPATLVAPAGEGEQWCLRELMRHVVSAEAGVANLVGILGRGETRPVDKRVAGMMADDDGRTWAEILSELRRTSETLLQTIRDLPDPPNTEATAPHPFFGELNCLEWAVFQRVHDEDHIQHGRRILAG